MFSITKTAPQVPVNGSENAALREVIKKHTIFGLKNHLFCIIYSRDNVRYFRDMCDVLVTSRPHFFLIKWIKLFLDWPSSMNNDST